MQRDGGIWGVPVGENGERSLEEISWGRGIGSNLNYREKVDEGRHDGDLGQVLDGDGDGWKRKRQDLVTAWVKVVVTAWL